MVMGRRLCSVKSIVVENPWTRVLNLSIILASQLRLAGMSAMVVIVKSGICKILMIGKIYPDRNIVV